MPGWSGRPGRHPAIAPRPSSPTRPQRPRWWCRWTRRRKTAAARRLSSGVPKAGHEGVRQRRHTAVHLHQHADFRQGAGGIAAILDESFIRSRVDFRAVRRLAGPKSKAVAGVVVAVAVVLHVDLDGVIVVA